MKVVERLSGLGLSSPDSRGAVGDLFAIGLAVLCCAIAACGGNGAETLVAPATPTPTATLMPSTTPTPGFALPVGLDAVTDLGALAELRPPGVRAAQVSSYDRTGANFDLGLGPDAWPYLERLRQEPTLVDNSHLYRDADRYVIFDSLGPGVVYRIWMTGLDALFDGQLGGDIAFEVDGEAVPRIELARSELFRGDSPPFLYPLAGDMSVSSGGHFSVLPIPYAHRLRILSSVAPNWMSISYLQLPSDQPVESFEPSLDSTAFAEALASVGVDPKAIAPTIDLDVPLVVEPGGQQEVWSFEGAGTVLGIEIFAPQGAILPLDLRLRATWDDAAVPQVDAPLDELFGAALGQAAESFAFGRDGDRFYCYFAMPFSSAARIELRNDGVETFTGWRMRLTAVDRLLNERPAYFSAQSNRALLEADGDDYVLLETVGTGHVVSITLTAGCPSFGACSLPGRRGYDGLHLEGDEHFYIDDSRYPQLHGTGMEDFFNGGFYFIGGPFTLPTHGNPSQTESSERRPGRTLRSAYRLFLGDAVPFYSGIKATIEHGPVNDVPAAMSSTVLYYAIPEVSLVASDQIVLGDQLSEIAHGVVATDRADVSLTSFFRGDASEVPVSARGIKATSTQFRVVIDADNQGVRVRRLADIGSGAQSAEVYVDGELAGTWYSADRNPHLRWADLDFDIPGYLTEGKSSIDIHVDASESPTAWTAFGYRIFSYRNVPVWKTTR